MEFRKLGRTGLKVTEICLGTAGFGAPTEDAEAHRMLDLYLDRGGNFVDTADIYSVWDEGSWAGRSEEPPADSRAAGSESMRRWFTDAGFALIDEMERIGASHDHTVGHVALAWHLSNPLITAPIVGARNTEQLEETLGAAGFRLSPEEMDRLNELSDGRQAEGE